MAISLLRIEPKLITEDMVRTWSREINCQGIIVINDAASKNKMLKTSYRTVTSKRTLIYSKEQFLKRYENVLHTRDYYYVMTKNPQDMMEIVTSGVLPKGTISVAAMPKRKDTLQIGEGFFLEREEALAFQSIERAGYEIVFLSNPQDTPIYWRDVKQLFGY